jgi:hypothetical protein
MSSGDSQRSRRQPGPDEIRETGLGRGRESREPLHPAPPAEGKWRGILGQVRGLLSRRRGTRQRP